MPRRHKSIARPRRRSPTPTSSSSFSDQGSMVLDVWLREPPSRIFSVEELRKLPSPYTTELDDTLPVESRLLLMGRKWSFEENKNPVLAIEAFLIARKAKLVPPLWVLDWLGEAFKAFHHAQGKQSLDRILGLVPKRGQRPVFKKLLEEERDQKLAFELWRIIALFNTTIDRAAEMVIRRLEETPDWNTSVYKIRPIAFKTLVDRYKKKWKKLFDTPDRRYQFLKGWTRAKAEAFLSTFPEDSYTLNDLRPSFLY